MQPLSRISLPIWDIDQEQRDEKSCILANHRQSHRQRQGGETKRHSSDFLSAAHGTQRYSSMSHTARPRNVLLSSAQTRGNGWNFHNKNNKTRSQLLFRAVRLPPLVSCKSLKGGPCPIVVPHTTKTEGDSLSNLVNLNGLMD